jgi:DNA-binding CsgD family transcriptional regulator
LRVLAVPSASSVLSLQVNSVQLRRLLKLGVILRWVAIGCAGLAGVLVAHPPELLFYLMLLAMVYNLGVMGMIGRASESDLRRLPLLVTVIDLLIELTFIWIYRTTGPNVDDVAPYIPALIGAVAYFGTAGAVLSVAIYAAVSSVADVVSLSLGLPSVSVTWLIEGTIIVSLMAAVLAAVTRILTAPADSAELAAAVQLSRREQEVLRLVAEGYSNTMIARRLNLSDNTVKGYVENLLGRLNARNRAEAVAAASRLQLL